MSRLDYVEFYLICLELVNRFNDMVCVQGRYFHGYKERGINKEICEGYM